MPRPLAALAALLLLAGSAFADTLAERFPVLAAEVDERLAGLTGTLTRPQKKEKSALTKADAALSAETTLLSKEIGQAKKALAALEPVFGTDPEISPLLDQLADAVFAEVFERNARMGRRASVLAESSTRTKALALQASVESKLSAAAESPSRTARAKAAGKALKSVVKGDALVAKVRTGGEPLQNELRMLVDGREVFLPTVAPHTYVVNFEPIPPGTLRFMLSTSAGGTMLNLNFNVQAPAVGSVPVSLQGSVLSGSGIQGGLPATAGTVTFTTADTVAGTYVGTFTMTFSNGTRTVEITEGSFVWTMAP